jgi:hypothetical protein
MVAINSISDLYRTIESIDWFSKLGELIECEAGYLRTNTLYEAMKMWNDPSFLEARSIAWEGMRIELLKNEALLNEWRAIFEDCNSKVVRSISGNDAALRLIASVGGDLKSFCHSLPFVGAAGELLLADKFPNYRFNSAQLSKYQDGHWVCGWRGALSVATFEYPELMFYVY